MITFPSGTILLLSGSTIPSGWAKCDGNNGTPNLINKFVFGAKVNPELKTTEKPKELIERIVLAFSNEGDVVADYYSGSGTTAKVCQELKRNFIGCDLSPKAIEITKARLNGGQ